MRILTSATGAVDIDGISYGDLTEVQGARRAQRTAFAVALRMEEPFELVTEGGNVQQGEAGDWVLQAGKGDVYVVRDSVFQRIYRLV
jgi:hypothetical protein